MGPAERRVQAQRRLMKMVTSSNFDWDQKNFYTAYDGELASLILALGLARRAPVDTNFFWILNDSQTALEDITNPPTPKSGQHTRSLILRELHRLLERRPSATVAFIWCAKAGEIEGLVKVDELAKQAAHLTSQSELPVSFSALTHLIRQRSTTTPPPSNINPSSL